MITQEFLDFLKEQQDKSDFLYRLAVEWNGGRLTTEVDDEVLRHLEKIGHEMVRFSQKEQLQRAIDTVAARENKEIP